MRRAAWLPLTLLLVAADAPPASATTPGSACHLAGFVRTSAGRCPQALAAGTAPRAQWLGPIGRAVGGVFGGAVDSVVKAVLSTIVTVMDNSAADTLRFTASLIGGSTEPALQSTWFSSAYWRVAALSALLTVPFLFAAAVHAIVRSDLAMLGRAAFGYLPLAMIGVGIAAPLTALMLSATDEMCTFVAAAGGNADTAFLGHAATAIAKTSVIATDPFVAFFAGVLTVSAAFALWLELLVRDAAVDVIVLMLPLFFAAMVWPARRVWAIRAIETLTALILAKFAMIAVLTLGAAALDDAASGLAALLSGATLILLATVSPWALLRVLPLHEVAAAAAGGMSQGPRDAFTRGVSRFASAGGRFGASRDDGASGDDGERGDDSDLAADVDSLTRLTRTPAALVGGRRHAGSTPAPITADDFDPETAMALAAVERAGGSRVDDRALAPEPATSGTAAASEPPLSLTREAADPRPPINPELSDQEWTAPFILGNGVTDRMSAPQLPVHSPDPEPPHDEPMPIEPPSVEPPSVEGGAERSPDA
jgi:hypothetical protein